MNVELITYQKTEAQLLAETILRYVTEHKVNDDLTSVMSFIPVHTRLFDEKQIQKDLDTLREALTEVCRTLDLKYPLPYSEFQDDEVDDLVDFACTEVEKIFRGTSKHSPSLEGNELIPEAKNIKVYVKIWIILYVQNNERSLSLELELINRNK